jgi:hypothetical protein
MAEPAPATQGVRPEIAREEAHGPELAPLAHVHELVGDQVTVVLVTTPQQDPTAERHARDSRREHAHPNETSAVEIADRDMDELLALASIEPP